LSERTYTTKEFAELVGRQTRTLYLWEQQGKLVPKKDFNGRNIYTEEDYEIVMGKQMVTKD
jgi:DNA-binding transcriptional MerR regulator